MAEEHVRHPSQVNQFNRLDRDTPTSPPRKGKPWNHVHADAKGNVIDWDGFLCMAAEGAVLANAATGGRLLYAPGQVHDRQHDNLGGIGVNDVKDALWSLAKIEVLTPAGLSWTETISEVRARRHVAIGVDYRRVPASAQLQHPGNFDHALGIDDYRDSDAWILVYDSLGTTPHWRPQSAVRYAAEALAARVRNTTGSLFVGLSGVRPPLKGVVGGSGGAPHRRAVVKKRTALYALDGHDAYVQPEKTKITIRMAIYVIKGKSCYPVVDHPGYYIPRDNITIGAKA